MGNHPSHSAGNTDYPEDAVTFSESEIVFPKVESGKSDTKYLEISTCLEQRIKFRFAKVGMVGCVVTFSPHKGKLIPNKPNYIKIKIHPINPANTDIKIQVILEGKYSKFFDLKIRCDGGVFGCDPASLDMAQDDGYIVPKVLVDMKQALEAHGAHQSEGIFRLAGDVQDVRILKQAVNAGTFKTEDVQDVHAVASLMKIWFRELPAPLLNAISPHSIQDSGVNNVLQECNGLPDPEKSLLFWLADLLCEYALHESVNKMSTQNLAIVVAPNLYNPVCANPLESMMLSQKSVAFFHSLVLSRLEHLKNRH